MSHPPDPSAVAVVFQALGALMLALLVQRLGRTFYFSPARLWSAGWLALAVALGAVTAWFYTPFRAFWIVYLLGQWIFLLLLWGGCREATARKAMPARAAWIAVPIALAAVAVMVRVAATFNDLFTMEAAIIAVAAVASMIALRRARSWTLMRTALAAMAALYTAYVPLFAVHEHVRAVPLLQYSSLLDLLVALFTGVAMIVGIAEAERQHLEETMNALNAARSAAEQRLHVDPLTEVLNRYAFHAMQRGDEIATDGSLAGVVAIFDIDNLKTINDQHGHTTGDHAIRAAATAIRNRVRAEDLLFRWGGDEFVVILPNLSAEQLRERLRALDAGISVQAEGGASIHFHLSWGEAEFGEKRSLTEAIQLADGAMYESRRKR